jgi:carbonyl reductase 1
LNDGALLIYLTARDKGRGEAALKDLYNDPRLKQAKALTADGGLTEIKYHQLDIAEPKSILEFSYFLKTNHPDGIDIGPVKTQDTVHERGR